MKELFGNLNKEDKEMDKKDEMMIVNHESLVKKIYIISGQKLMLDFEQLTAQTRIFTFERTADRSESCL